MDTEGAPNCWEVARCGRGPDAIARGEEACPAALAYALGGVNRGQAGGRACWTVAGSLATGPAAGTCPTAPSCLECGFYHSVRLDEGPGFRMWPRVDDVGGRARMRLRG